MNTIKEKKTKPELYTLLGNGRFGKMKCNTCKNKNTVTVGNGWSLTRCRKQPQKEFHEIESDGSCNYEPCA